MNARIWICYFQWFPGCRCPHLLHCQQHGQQRGDVCLGLLRHGLVEGVNLFHQHPPHRLRFIQKFGLRRRSWGFVFLLRISTVVSNGIMPWNCPRGATNYWNTLYLLVVLAKAFAYYQQECSKVVVYPIKSAS